MTAVRLCDVLRGGPLQAHRVPGSVLGPYVIEAEIGRGGMGAVYRARHAEFDRLVALKVLLAGPGAKPSQRKRFLREAKLGASLEHPGVVRVLDYGESDDMAYLALEFVEGTTLHKLIDGLEHRVFVEIMVGICDAVAAAHAKGIVHRDLKPANILVRPDGRPAVTDFGLAREADLASSLTKSGAAVGTPHYMAPEQTRAHDPTPATDVFALGVMLYRGLTRALPFPSTTISALFVEINTTTPRPPHLVASDVSAGLSAVCMKALSKAAADRHPTAAELASDLKAYLDQQLPDPRRFVMPALAAAAALVVFVAVFVAFGLAQADSSSPKGPEPIPPAPPGPALPERIDSLPVASSQADAGRVAPAGALWTLGVGLSKSQLLEETERLKAARRSLRRVEANDDSRPHTFSAVWMEGKLKSVLHVDLSPTEWAKSWTEERRRYRLVARTLSGAYGSHRQTGLWFESGGQRWVSFGSQTAGELTRRQKRNRKKGYRPTCLSATSGPGTRFGTNWIKDGTDGDLVLGLDAQALVKAVNVRVGEGFRLNKIERYGPADETYGATWIQDHTIGLTFQDQPLDAFVQTSELLAALGYVPEVVVERGEAQRGRVTSLWARSAVSRTWRVTGPEAPSSAVDTAVRTYMERHDVSCGAVAVTQGRRLVLARGYTWAPPSQRLTTAPTSLFRLGALSKPLTAVTVLRLVEEGKLTLARTVRELFPELVPTEVWDPRFLKVTVAQLLSHRGGWDRHREPLHFDPKRGVEVFDPTFGNDRRVAASLPLTSAAVFECVSRRALDFAPGTRSAYGDVGYVLLGLIIERVAKQPYAAAVRAVLERAGPTELRLAGDRLEDRASGEVFYEGARLARSVLGAGERVVPFQYGGIRFAATHAANGWAGSAVDVARFVSAFSDPRRSPLLESETIATMWTAAEASTYGLGWSVNGPATDPRASHDAGDLPGTWGVIERAPGGLGVVALFNRQAPDPEFVEALRRAITSTNWPQTDSFQAKRQQ